MRNLPLKLTPYNIETYYNDLSIRSFLESNLSIMKGVVLDIGCGKKKYQNLILSAPDVSQYKGMDLEAGKFVYDSLADIYWDGITMPLENNSVDTAILTEVIEHCLDPKIVTKESYRVLKPGGSILFSTPFIYHLHGMPHDYSRPASNGLLELFKSAGFSKVEIYAGAGLDASLGQTIAIWISQRPMNKMIKKILRYIFVPIFLFLLYIDKKKVQDLKDGALFPNLLGIATK